jgi:versiconal hemiacetal acetate esterase
VSRHGVIQHLGQLGGDLQRFFTVGSSAGGGIALAVKNKLIKIGHCARIKGIVVALIPVAVHPDNVPSGYESIYTSYVENETDIPLIDSGTMRTFFESFDAKPDDSVTFASQSDVLGEFPPSYIVTCGKDPLEYWMTVLFWRVC